MTNARTELRQFEGRNVCVALTNGTRLDDCELVSVGRGGTRTLWLWVNEADAFIPYGDLVAVWESSPLRAGKGLTARVA